MMMLQCMLMQILNFILYSITVAPLNFFQLSFFVPFKLLCLEVDLCCLMGLGVSVISVIMRFPYDAVRDSVSVFFFVNTCMYVSALFATQTWLLSLLGLCYLILQLLFGAQEHNDVKSISHKLWQLE